MVRFSGIVAKRAEGLPHNERALYPRNQATGFYGDFYKNEIAYN
jgi:hypothetical protein